MKYQFEDLPLAVSDLHVKLDEIMLLLKQLQVQHTQNEEFLNLEDAARLLKLRPATIYKKIRRRELPGAFKRGKQLYFRKTLLLQFIEDGRLLSQADHAAIADKLVSRRRRK